MEGYIAEIFAQLLGAPREKAGLVLFSITNFYSWLTIIDDLIAIDDTFTPIKDEWGQIAKKLKELNDTRVRLAHHTSFGIEGMIGLLPSHLDKRPKSQKYEPLNNTQIDKFCDDVEAIMTRIIALHRAIHSLPRKSVE